MAAPEASAGRPASGERATGTSKAKAGSGGGGGGDKAGGGGDKAGAAPKERPRIEMPWGDRKARRFNYTDADVIKRIGLHQRMLLRNKNLKGLAGMSCFISGVFAFCFYAVKQEDFSDDVLAQIEQKSFATPVPPEWKIPDYTPS